MPTKIQCANPDCMASFADAQTELAYCPKCGSKISQADGLLSFPTRTFDRNTPMPSMNEGIDANWQFRKGTLFADRFTIVNRLGFGGMGEVYHARDTKLPRDVAIKVVLPHWLNDENFLRRFQREAHAVAMLKHPNICTIYDVGEWNGRPYIVMDFIDGTSLGSYLKKRTQPFDPIQAAKLVRMVAQALQSAHDAAIIHRDLKPDNIMLGRNGRPIVMDFGLAKAQEAAEEDHLTASGAMMGTAHYMPIEQFRDAGKADARSDIYSLGVIFYRLLAGQLPYPGRNPQAVFAAVLETTPVPPSAVRPEIDPQLDAIVMKAMAREAGERYGSMTEFVRAIDAYGKGAERSAPVQEPVVPKPEPENVPSPSVRIETEPERKRPVESPKKPPREPVLPLSPFDRRLILATVLGIVAVFLGILIYVATDQGTLKAGLKAGDLKTVQVGDVKVVFCWCPPGTFTMGSPPGEPDRDKDDEDQVDVTLTKGFWMMQTEMTQELYEVIMGKNPSFFQGPKLPVEMVSHTDAVECAARLTKRMRDAGLLPEGWEYRLPTEAQWEYAARARTKMAFPFGPTLLSSQANFHSDKTCEVRKYQANPWGIFDTCGNVWEWTLDGYDTKMPGGSDPFVKDGSYRVIRGGSWGNAAEDCRAACRNWYAPTYTIRYLGLRLARVPSEPSK